MRGARWNAVAQFAIRGRTSAINNNEGGQGAAVGGDKNTAEETIARINHDFSLVNNNNTGGDYPQDERNNCHDGTTSVIAIGST